ncbi:MAG: hypothetical protein ACREQ5_11660, partial [Candidatus Dormibacteria bacterium]
YEYDAEAARHADDAALRLDTTGAYVGTFISAHEVRSQSGGKGIEIGFESASDKCTCRFTLWTKDAEGNKNFGFNLLNGLMSLTDVKSLAAKPIVIQGWKDGKKGDVDTVEFPALLKKPIGVVLQKELTTRQAGGDSYRFNLVGSYHPVSHFTSTELTLHASKPEKLDKMLKGLKDKDSRKINLSEPHQPTIGVATGDY